MEPSAKRVSDEHGTNGSGVSGKAGRPVGRWVRAVVARARQGVRSRAQSIRRSTPAPVRKSLRVALSVVRGRGPGPGRPREASAPSRRAGDAGTLTSGLEDPDAYAHGSWRDRTAPKTAERLIAVLADPLYGDVNHWRAKPRAERTYYFPVRDVLRATDPETARRLLMGRFRPASRFPETDLGVPPPWDVNPVGLTTWDYYRHALDWTRPLVAVWYTSADSACLRRFVDILQDWSRHNAVPPGSSRYAWNDHAVAMRLRLLVWFWELYRRSADLDWTVGRLVLASIHQHALFAVDERTYRPQSNHGLESVGALLAAAVTVPEFTEADAWRRAALRRLEAYVDDNFSKGGIHREQSPMYHLFVLRRLAEITGFLETNGQHAPEPVRRTLERGVAAWPHFIRADGTLPTIGDSLPPVTAGWRRDLETLVGGPLPGPTVSSAPNPRGDGADLLLDFDAGYALFTCGTMTEGGSRDDLHVAFKCNYYRFSHFHRDGGSLTLFRRGREWLTDPGLYNYQEDDERRRYVRSARAHNVVLVDGEDFDVHPVRLVDWGRTAQEDFVTVEHALPAVSHRRTVSRRGSGEVVITDRLMADDRPHRYMQLLHVASGLAVDIREDHAQLSDGERVAEIRQATAGRWHVVEGCEDPLQGWVSPRLDEFVPAPVLVFESAPAREHVFETHVDVRPRWGPERHDVAP